MGIIFCSRGSPGVLLREGGGTTFERSPSEKRGVSPELGGLPGARGVPSPSRGVPGLLTIVFLIGGQRLSGAHFVQVNLLTKQK